MHGALWRRAHSSRVNLTIFNTYIGDDNANDA